MSRCICANCGAKYCRENDACPWCGEIAISGFAPEIRWDDE